MKRIASGLLALALTFSLCACGAETASSSLSVSAESSAETTKIAAAPAADDDAMAKTAVTDGTEDVENTKAPDTGDDAVDALGDLLDGKSPSTSGQENAMQKLVDYLLEDGSEIAELEGSGIKIPHSMLNSDSDNAGDVSALAARPGDTDLYYYTIISDFTQVGILSGDTFTFQLAYEDYTLQGKVDIGTYHSGDTITLIKSDFPVDPPDSLLTSITDLAFSMVNLCAVSAGVTMQELGFTYYDSDDSSTTSDAAAFSGTSASASTSTASATTGEKNALDSAKSYLNAMAFSYDGLVDQLEFEGFTHSEAVYGADHCGADWMEQAARMAESYLNSGSFSRSSLIDQLEFEGFTNAQAVYGVEQNGY